MNLGNKKIVYSQKWFLNLSLLGWGVSQSDWSNITTSPTIAFRF